MMTEDTLPNGFMLRYFYQYNMNIVNTLQDLIFFQQLWLIDSRKETRLVPKWTTNHMNPQRAGKMKVSYATQVFSHSASAAMKTLIALELMPAEAEGTAIFLEVWYID